MKKDVTSICHYVMAIFLIILFSTGCVVNEFEDSSLEPIDDLYSLKSINVKSQLINDYALMLALSLSDEIKAKIKLEAQKKFDGDFDILSSTFEEISLVNNKRIKSVLAETKSRNGHIFRQTTHLSGDELLEKITQEIPNLQISVPIHCNDWETSEFTPLVAYLPFYYDDQSDDEM